MKDQYKLQLAFPKNTRGVPDRKNDGALGPRQVVSRAGRGLGMGAMEKKRLLFALIAAALVAVSWVAVLSKAGIHVSLRGNKDRSPAKRKSARAKKLHRESLLSS